MTKTAQISGNIACWLSSADEMGWREPMPGFGALRIEEIEKLTGNLALASGALYLQCEIVLHKKIRFVCVFLASFPRPKLKRVFIREHGLN